MEYQGMVIDFGADGSVEALHREGVMDLGFLGPQEIQRATDIRFDSATQTWGIWPSDGAGGFSPPPAGGEGFKGYEEARKVEVEWLELCRLYDTYPLGSSGLKVLATIRRRP